VGSFLQVSLPEPCKEKASARSSFLD